MSSQDDIFDALTRHQIFVLRYARGRELEAERFIAGTLNEVIYRLEEQPLTAFGRARLQNQARDLYEYLKESGSSYAQSLRNDMVRFGGYEAAFNQRVLQKNLQIDIGIPSPMQIQQAAFLDVMGLEPSQGYTLGGMVDEFAQRNANRIFAAIRQAAVLGDTTDDLIRYIREIEPMQKRKAATLARTAVNHVAVQARKETLKENDDVLLGYEWVATLDSRTSLICMSRDGIIYKDYDKDPKPPAHFNCRSTIVPKVNPKFDLGADIVGTRAAKGSGGAGQVSAGLNYDQWLRKQSETFQNKVLGKSRAKLFRKGMTIDKFVDNRGKTLTLAELRRDDAQYVLETEITPNVSLSGRVRFDDINQCKDLTAEELSQFLDDKLSPDLKRLVTTTERPSRIFDGQGNGSWYQPWDKGLHQKSSDRTAMVFAHEYGHHIDFELGDKKYLSFSAYDSAFKQALLDDRKELGLRASKTKGEAMDMLSLDLFDRITKTNPATGRTSIKKVPKGDWATMASDIVDAMAGGQFRKRGHWGHPISYWKDKGAKEQETFANLFAMRGDPQAWAFCQRRFPRLCKRFDEIIEEALKAGKNTYDG